jgi:hypothetical protein
MCLVVVILPKRWNVRLRCCRKDGVYQVTAPPLTAVFIHGERGRGSCVGAAGESLVIRHRLIAGAGGQVADWTATTSRIFKPIEAGEHRCAKYILRIYPLFFSSSGDRNFTLTFKRAEQDKISWGRVQRYIIPKMQSCLMEGKTVDRYVKLTPKNNLFRQASPPYLAAVVQKRVKSIIIIEICSMCVHQAKPQKIAKS